MEEEIVVKLTESWQKWLDFLDISEISDLVSSKNNQGISVERIVFEFPEGMRIFDLPVAVKVSGVICPRCKFKHLYIVKEKEDMKNVDTNLTREKEYNHVLLNQAIENLENLDSKVDRLLYKIKGTGAPEGCDSEDKRSDPSLSEILKESSVRINKFVESIEATIDSIETELF